MKTSRTVLWAAIAGVGLAAGLTTAAVSAGNPVEDRQATMKGVAQSSTRVSTFMRNIDSSSWMDNPQLQVVEVAKDSPTGGSSFTLTSDVVGVDVDNGGETTVKKVAAK